MNSLRFIKPETAISIGRSEPIRDADYTTARGLPLSYEAFSKLYKKMPSMTRNIAAFYLRLSGTRTSEIASVLNISASRVISASSQGAKCVLHKWDLPAYSKTKVLDKKVFRSPTRLEKLTFHVDRAQAQLIYAETVMSWLHRNDDLYLVSAALKIGKINFEQMKADQEILLSQIKLTRNS